MVEAAIPATEPTEFIRGDTVSWTKAFASYLPEDGWSLTYYFTSQSDYQTIAASDNGDGSFLAAINLAASQAFEAGTYQWQAVVTKTDEQKTLDSGTVVVKPGFVGVSAGFDDRTFAKKVLDKLEELILSTADHEETNLAIDGVSMSFETKADLIVARDRFKREVAEQKLAEDLANGQQHGIRVRF